MELDWYATAGLYVAGMRIFIWFIVHTLQASAQEFRNCSISDNLIGLIAVVLWPLSILLLVTILIIGVVTYHIPRAIIHLAQEFERL